MKTTGLPKYLRRIPCRLRQSPESEQGHLLNKARLEEVTVQMERLLMGLVMTSWDVWRCTLTQIDPVPTDYQHILHPGTAPPSCHVPLLYSALCNKKNSAFIPPHAAAPPKNQLLAWNNHVKIVKHFSFGNIKSNILLGPVNPT